MQLPSLEAMEIMAISDRPLFEHIMSQIGLPITGLMNTNPLEKDVQTESISAVASELTEDRHEFASLDPRRRLMKQMAEFHGYIVAIA